ncbi:hypothetical protein LCGC14_2405530, partial [marine sediment metagenome]
IQCDYIYGLSEAIRDGVCRVPNIIAIDNDNILVTENEESKSYGSFKELLTHSIFPYHELITNEQLILHMLNRANNKLEQIRETNCDAGGLIVASSVEHARAISQLVSTHLKESATVITYQEEEPTSLIHQYRYCNSKWVISVGMISEGTNIPRLQVCCHLTNIKTEMHYRQILGRALRRTDAPYQEAFLFMPAEPKLIEYALRVANDVPNEADVVKFEKMSCHFKANNNSAEKTKTKAKLKPKQELGISDFSDTNILQHDINDNSCLLTATYEGMIGIFGRFKEEALELELTF